MKRQSDASLRTADFSPRSSPLMDVPPRETSLSGDKRGEKSAVRRFKWSTTCYTFVHIKTHLKRESLLSEFKWMQSVSISSSFAHPRPFLAFLYFSSVFLQFQAAILLFESILRSFVSEVYEHTFIFCSTSSDTLATISSRDRPVSEPCLLCRTSFIKPVNSKLAAPKRKTKKAQMS